MDNTANFAALKDATLGAANISAPVSTLGASNAPELASLYQSTFQLPQSNGAVAAGAQISGDIVAEQKAAAAAARAAAAKREANMSDINKYKIVRKDDGGYDFFDADGNQVDIATLTKRTGVKASDIVKDSENPVDIQYVNDYNNLQDYISAKLSNDKKKTAAYEASKPELAKYQGKGGAHQLINDFQNYYQRYYVPRDVNPSAWGTSPGDTPFVPTGGDAGESFGIGD